MLSLTDAQQMVTSFIDLSSQIHFTFFIYLFIFDCARSLLVPGFSLTVASRGYSPVAVHGLIVMAFLLQSMGSRCSGFSSYSTWAVFVALWL